MKSILQNSRIFSLFVLLLFSVNVQSQTVINDSLEVETLVNDFFNSGVLVSISNIIFNGIPANSVNPQIGLFTNGTADSLNMESGMVMSSGNVRAIVDSSVYNEVDDFQDADLQSIAGFQVHNCAVLEFDVLVNADALAFSYFFGSTEYDMFTCSHFNDVFALFISGPGIDGPYTNGAKNIATIPNSEVPVGINTVNRGMQSMGYDPVICQQANPNWQQDSQYYISNEGNQVSSISFNGFTQNFEAYTEVENGEIYHIKFAICNTSDGTFPSGVFLETGSFEGRLLSGITEPETNTFAMYPNPAKNLVYLKGSNVKGNANVDIKFTSIDGKIVAEYHKTQSDLIPIDVSGLDSGVYIISAKVGDTYLGVQKLIKE